MEPGQVVASIIALSATGVIGYGGILGIHAVVRHYSPKNRESDAELENELREIRGRLDESDQLRERIAELEERLDFAERLLAQKREAGQLPAGGERP
jgi:hypothetical protein